MNEGIDKECGIHGARWDHFHDGYFSNVEIAGPHLDEIAHAQAASKAKIIVDLGGGTGFVLDQLAQRNLADDATLINLECSDAQLATADSRHIRCVQASIIDFTRDQVAREEEHVLWIMRSALHYFGEAGLSPVLQYLRKQARDRELFVHQTASFENDEQAACLNMLYKEMRTEKWYPTVDHLEQVMTEAGWCLSKVTSVPPLPLTSHDLAQRYGLSAKDVSRIRADISQQFGEIEGVFELRPEGFCAYLHYKVYRASST